MSDPSAIQIPVSQALTSDMMYGLKPSAPKSRSYRISQAPVNKSVFVGGDQIIIELPTSRKNTYFDQSMSYLKFSVQCSSTASASSGGSGAYLDGSAYSFFQRLDIYNSSNLLETINEYSSLCNFLIDTSLTQSDKAGLSTLIGTNATTTAINTQATYAQNNPVNFTQVPGDRSGLSIPTVSTASGINSAVPVTFCLPMLSGVIGVNASKMLPTGLLNAPIRIELFLSQNDDAMYYGTSAAGLQWQLVNVEFCACYVEISDDSIEQAFNGPAYISTQTYRHASTFLPSATSGEFTSLIPFRCASLNSIYARFRNLSTTTQGSNSTAGYRKGSSINPNISSFYYRIGNSVLPNKPVFLLNGSLTGNGAEAYAELLKSFHSLSSSIGNSALVYNNYNVCATATQGFSGPFVPGSKVTSANPDSHANAFAIGLELQSFSNRNDTILSGISTLNTQIFATYNINTGATAGGTNSYNYTIDHFGHMDMILVIENGIMMAKF